MSNRALLSVVVTRNHCPSLCGTMTYTMETKFEVLACKERDVAPPTPRRETPGVGAAVVVSAKETWLKDGIG